MAKVYEFIANGTEEVEALIPVDVLRRAGVDIVIVSATGDKVVTSAHGVNIVADALVEDIDVSDADLLMIPGGIPGAPNLCAHPIVRDMIQKQYEAGKLVSAICAGPMIFGSLGIAKGKRCTCYPGCEGDIAEAEYTAELVTVDGNVITSNYTGGTMSALHINADGSLSDLFAMYVPEGEGESHMHCATLSPDGKYLFANDLGKDAVYRFTTGDSSNPFKDACTAYQFDRNIHPGPRHMVFSQDGRFAYLLHELGDMLTVFSYDDGVLEHLSTQMAYDGVGHGSADLHFSPDGRFLYTSHRLKEDGISVFSINIETGEATRAGFCKTGNHPRNFAVSPDGQYILCACRDSQKVEIYKINSETGMPENTGKSIPVPDPMFVMFR